MITMIVTDYRSISRSLAVCVSASRRLTQICTYIIVDNSDRHDGITYLTQESIEYIETKEFEKQIYDFEFNGIKILLIDAEENGGYAKGNNLGAKLAKSRYKSDIYLFSNNDLEFPQSIECQPIESIFNSDSSIGIIGPNVLYKGINRQNPRRYRSIWSQEIFWNFNAQWFHCRFNNILGNLESNPQKGKVDWVTGCFLFISAKAFDRIGGFDEETFLYAEEVIISSKMRNHGYITYYNPDITIIHNHQGVDNRKMRTILHKSKMYYYKRYCKNNFLELGLADVSFYIVELGYYLYHDVLKKRIMKRD